MFGGLAPSSLLSQSLDALIAQLPALRDGDEQAIHQARVALRRAREAFALVTAHDAEDQREEIDDRLSRMFKALGRARDADIAQRLVQHVERRFTLIPATLGQLRSSAARDQLAARRKMIKALEALDVHLIPLQLERTLRASTRGLRGNYAWRGLLKNHVARRAEDVRHAVAHAGGVYFPNRSHSARVAIKHLRYAIELADASGTWHLPRPRRPLRKAQEALGEAHDREVLLQRLHGLSSEGVAVSPSEASALDQFLRGEIQSLHERYLAARPAILDICAACETAPRTSLLGAGTVAAAAVAVPAMLLLRRR
jgi:CHAD domain-containing protein